MEITGQTTATKEQKAHYTARMSIGASLSTRTRKMMKDAGKKKAKLEEEVEEVEEIVEAAPVLETLKH